MVNTKRCRHDSKRARVKRRYRRGWKKSLPDKPKRVNPEGQRSYVYLLHLTGKKRCAIYTGFTVNPARRLRQHKGELKNGARATKSGESHSMVFMMGASPTWFQQKEAQMLEWRCKKLQCHGNTMTYQTRMLTAGESRKIILSKEEQQIGKRICKILNMLNSHPQWTSNSPVYLNDRNQQQMRYYLRPDLLKAFPALSQILNELRYWPGTLEPLVLEGMDKLETIQDIEENDNEDDEKQDDNPGGALSMQEQQDETDEKQVEKQRCHS